MANIKGCFSHKTDHWATPKYIYDFFQNLGFIDPCPLHCENDNLFNIYENKLLFINPPYSDIKSWVDFARRHVDIFNCNVALLVPSRTDTKWFHKLVNRDDFQIYFIKGRLRFNDCNKSAPFPSVFIFIGSLSNVYKSYTKELFNGKSK